MSTGRLRQRVLAAFICCLAPLAAACPLPIAHTEALSAPLTGIYLRTDGTRVSGAVASISTDGRDTTCARGIMRTVTDSAGVFRFPGTEKRYRVVWVIPNFDRATTMYYVCLGVGDTLHRAYRGYGSLRGSASPDSIMCIEWEWQARRRVACSGQAERTVATGGRWAVGDEGGWYQVFLTEEPEPPTPRPHIYVQWVVQPASGLRHVRQSAEVVVDRKVWALWDPVVWTEGGRWYVSFDGFKHAFMNDLASAHLRYQLGLPGEVTKVVGP